jgi:hypothetical protein
MRICQYLFGVVLCVAGCRHSSPERDANSERVDEVIRILELYDPATYDFQKQKQKYNGAILVDTHGCEQSEMAARLISGPEEWKIVRDSPVLYFEAVKARAINPVSRNRACFIELLGMLGEPSVEPLIHIVLSDSDQQARSLALIAACANRILPKSVYSRKVFEDAGVSNLALAWFDYLTRGDQALQALHRSVLDDKSIGTKTASKVENLRLLFYISRVRKVETLFVLCQMLKRADIEASHVIMLTLSSMLDSKVISEGHAILHLRRGNETLAQRLETWLWANAEALKWDETVSKYKSE